MPTEIVNADHILGSSDRTLEPQRKNNFVLRVAPPKDSGAEDILVFALDSMPFPEESNEVKEIHYGNEIRKYAGKPSYSDEKLTVVDWVDGRTARVIDAWRQKVYDKVTGAISRASDYKVEGDMIFFDPTGEKPRYWKLLGMWPSSVKFGGGDMNTTDSNKIEVTFVVDKIVYNDSDSNG